jgi:hypothetical protein
MRLGDASGELFGDASGLFEKLLLTLAGGNGNNIDDCLLPRFESKPVGDIGPW